MSVWPMDVVQKVARVEVKLRAPKDITYRLVIHEEMFKQLQKTVQAFGVDVNIEDMTVTEGSVEGQPLIGQYRMKWAPTTRRVVLMGGPGAGGIYTVRDVAAPYEIESLATIDWTRAPEAELQTTKTIYKRSGWDDVERAWVFTPTI